MDIDDPRAVLRRWKTAERKMQRVLARRAGYVLRWKSCPPLNSKWERKQLARETAAATDLLIADHDYHRKLSRAG